MTNYELVRNKVIEAVPEIMKLEFGCKVLYGSEKTDESIVTIGYPYVVEDKKVINPWNLDDSEYLIEILGREIRLSDVLRTVFDNGIFITCGGDFFEEHTSYGEYGLRPIIRLVKIDGRKRRVGKIISWNLAHDSLEWHRDNRPETVDFLAEILK